MYLLLYDLILELYKCDSNNLQRYRFLEKLKINRSDLVTEKINFISLNFMLISLF